MSLSKQYGTDAELERKGVAFEFSANDDGSIPTFYLTRMSRSNPQYQKVADRLWAPHRKAMKSGALSQEKQDWINQSIFCEAILVGWKNIPLSDVTGNTADKGHAPYNAENAQALMKRLPDLYDTLNGLAIDRQNFQAAAVEEDAGNSSPSLNTPSSTAAAK